MNFSIKSTQDKFIENTYKKSMEDLDKFFNIGWVRNTPHIVIVPDRKTIDGLRREQTQSWVVGWADTNSRTIYILERKNFEKESNHKYSKEEYIALIKHELTHMFVSVYIKASKYKPTWLSEGVATYISGQNKFKKPVKKFEKFLECYEKIGPAVYSEAGFFIEILFNKFGKEKLLNLITILKDGLDEKEFNKKFKQIYGFELNYKKINKIK